MKEITVGKLKEELKYIPDDYMVITISRDFYGAEPAMYMDIDYEDKTVLITGGV